MTKKKTIAAIILGLGIGVAFSFGNLRAMQSFQNVINNYRPLFQQAPSSRVTATTLYEAWDIARGYAQAWSQDATLTSLISSDVNDPDANALSGSDGRRRTWLVEVTSQKQGKQLFFQINNGEVIHAAEDGIYDPATPTFSEKPAIDSEEVLKQAKSTMAEFASSIGRGRGYHFALQAVNGYPVLTVIGSSKSAEGEQKVTALDLDVKAGQIIAARIVP